MPYLNTSGYTVVPGQSKPAPQPGSYTPPLNGQQSYQQLPNSGKLTPMENWMFGKLPGINAWMSNTNVPLMGKSVAEALKGFNDSWGGKLLSVLDIGAEGLERSSGMVSQYLQAERTGTTSQYWKDLKSAWTASSLFSDMTNLPTFTRDKAGKITGLGIPTDLPGSDGLAAARNAIANGASLEQVRENYYSNLGALTLRAQLYDTYFHVVADPLNYVLPYIKPIESIQASRKAIEAFGVADEVIDELKTSLKVAEEAQNLTEAAKITARIDELSKATNDWRKTGNLLTQLFNHNERLTVALTGGEFWKPTEELTGLAKTTRKLAETKSILNPFYMASLTPEARAYELGNIVMDNVGARIINGLNDPEEIAQRMKMATISMLNSPQIGHAFLTREGRMTQSIMAGFSTEVDSELAAYRLIENERNVLYLMSSTLNETPAQIIAKLRDGSMGAAIVLSNRLAKAGQAVDANKILEIGAKLKDAMYTPELFKLNLMNKLADHTAKQGVVMFGVKARGLAQKLSMALKEAETLAFLKANPAYAIRNVLNNELTMIARGAVADITDLDMIRALKDDVKFLQDVIGFEPQRFAQGIGPSGSALEEGMKIGTNAIADTLRGEGDNVTKVADWIKGVGGNKNFATLAQQAEQSASKRAFTINYMRAMKRYYWKPGVGFDFAQDYLPKAIRDTVPDAVMNEINNAVKASNGSKKYIDNIFNGTENINLNWESIAKSASDRVGFDVTQALPAELIYHIQDDFEQAAKVGKVPEFITDFRLKLQKEMDNLSKTVVDDYARYIENQVKIEGAPVLYKVYGDLMDEFTEAHLHQFMKMQDLEDNIRNLVKFEDKRKFWTALKAENSAYYERTFDRLEGGLKGIQRGAKEAGITIPDEAIGAIKQLRTETRKFYQFRDKLLDSYFDTLSKKGVPANTFDEIRNQITQKYDELMTTTDKLNRSVDKAVGNVLGDPNLQNAFMAWRSKVADMRVSDAQNVKDFYGSLSGLAPEFRNDAYTDFWKMRSENWTNVWKETTDGRRLLEGNPEVLSRYTAEANRNSIIDIAKQYQVGITGKETTKAVSDRQILNTINKYLPDEVRDALPNGKYEDLRFVPDWVARESLGQDAVRRGIEIPVGAESNRMIETGMGIAPGQQEQEAAATAKYFSPEGTYPKLANGEFFNPLLPKEQYWASRGTFALDALEQSAKEQLTKKAFKFSDLPEETQTALRGYFDHVSGQAADVRYASTRFAEFGRDAALLNYNRRYNYNTYLGVVFPYEFWATQSLFKWALHSIDRPAMFSTYLRFKKMIETSGAPRQSVPSRLKGSLKIELPFMPDWMGETFVDPLRMALPFDTFASVYEQTMQNINSKEYGAERILADWQKRGTYNPNDIQQALNTHEGDLWEQASQQAVDDDANLKFDALDAMSLLISPHAPLVWGHEVLRGTPERIQPFTPAQKIIRNASSLLGIDWDNSPMNIEGRIRKSLGLPAFDRWDEYRINRTLSNMATEGKITANDALRAMIEKDGDVYDDAKKRTGKETAGGGLAGFLLKTLGVPLNNYPPGELLQRSLKDDFGRAYKAYLGGDVSALTNFYELHPEYETRQALWKSPEEQLQSFLVDNIWDKWHSLPKLTQNEIKDQLGDQFQQAFLNRETYSYESIPIQTMQVWLKLMGGDPPGTLSSTVPELKLTDSDIAWRAQSYYDVRNQMFPDWYEQQQEYYALPEGTKRKQYKTNHPDYAAYITWKYDYLNRNPEVAPYLTEAKYLPQYTQKQLQQAQPNLTWGEWQVETGIPVSNLVKDYVYGGNEIPDIAKGRLQELADKMGMTYDQLIEMMGNSLR